jgi:hypothetical protein
MSKPALIVVAVVMSLGHHHFVVMAVSVPATIMVPIPVASLDDDSSFLGLRRRSERQYKAESRQRGECQYDLAHVILQNISQPLNGLAYQSFGGTIVPMTT